MEAKLHLDILPQPDDTTCGPTCLHAVYRYYGDYIELDQVIREVEKLEGGGTLGVLLGNHALSRGYSATLYTYDIQVFDPSWFVPGCNIPEKLKEQLNFKREAKLKTASYAYLDFLNMGGRIYFEDLTSELVRGLLKRTVPVVTGLSATYLYKTPRERSLVNKIVYDDIRGEPSGHFVVLCGYNSIDRIALVADPLLPNPISATQFYEVKLNRLILSIMLGILTFDANLLVISPVKKTKSRRSRVHAYCTGKS